MAKNWKTTKENLKYQDWRFKIYDNEVLAPNGKKLNLTRCVIKPGAFLVGLTQDGKIPLIKQYRYPVDEYFLEVPSGGVDVEKESYKEAAIREFTEEAGYVPKNVQLVSKLQSSGSLNFPMEIYFSNNLEKGETKFDDPELGSRVLLLSFKECMQKIENGEIHDLNTIACLLLCKQKELL